MKNQNKDTNKTNKQTPISKKGKKKNNKSSLYFFLCMIVLYIVLYFISPDQTLNALRYVLNIVKEIVPILLFVYVFMVIFALLNEEKLKNSIETAPPILKYILMSLLGTLSHGPIYAWYPFLKTLHEKNLSKGTVGSFLYARGIKLALLPMLISFFDLKYVIILTIVMLLSSLTQGILIDLTE